MSQSLALIIFPSNEEGHLFETDSETVERAVISDSLLRRISDAQIFVHQPLFEEPGSPAQSQIMRVDDEKLDELLQFLEQEFLALVSATRHGASELIVPSEVLTMIHDVRTVCNLHALVTLKKDRFPECRVALKVS